MRRTPTSCTTPPIPRPRAPPSARWSRPCGMRRDRGTGPFTGQSCDNLQGNGAVLRQTVVSLARLSDPALADWIDSQLHLPQRDGRLHRAGDRAEGDRAGAGVRHRRRGAGDPRELPPMGDRGQLLPGPAGLGQGAARTFSDDVHGYETQKIRILNAGHQVLCELAELMEVEMVSEIMAHPTIRALLEKVEREEIVPHVVPVPGMTPLQYLELIERALRQPDDRRHHPPDRLRRLLAPPGLRAAHRARRAGGGRARSRASPWSRPPGAGCAPAPATTAR